ncbi:MATE family efflux transporter [Allorhizobium taibaishanense]|uniref:MATE family efflux transporter n=1 Tax=Allorhizobium taibaishanense TaxID=887144 RepID=A0A1Q9A921_9HYPH|nr:MATE family efflux transporter [Allorhizobium taibaishanense]MBB4009382.1 MATE family multidrug resistance protein [Allorhizobium taibaishanense]OLP51068.1 MATE family efflux transporter [Allorhizobium taibaishanense]
MTIAPTPGAQNRAFIVTHRAVLAIAIPMTLGYITTPLLGITDTAVIGRTGEAAALAGLAIGAAVFDLVFASLNFLRASTTALVAQAHGRRDEREQIAVFCRSMILSLGIGLLLLALSPVLLKAGLALMGAEGRVAEVTSIYFSTRILAGPLTLSNFTIMGFILGRGKGSLALALQILLNGVNILLSILLGLHFGWGVSGVAWGAVAGEATAAIVGLAVILIRTERSLLPSMAELLDRQQLGELFALNRDILIRSFVLLGAFTLLTRIGTGFGAVTLAANALLMNFFMVASFYLDGVANAAEQIVGRAVGARYRPAFDQAVRLTTVWSFGLAITSMVFFLLVGGAIIDAMTTAADVREVARIFLPWAAVTALTGALAFQMDGVFIGAAWSSDMRNMMLAAFVGYLIALAIFVPLLGNHGLWLALNLFLAFRGLFLALRLKSRSRQTFADSQC